MTDWDWTSQQAETVWTVNDIAARTDVQPGAVIDLDIQTVDAGGGARKAYLEALNAAGYVNTSYVDDETRIETIEITVPSARFDADHIWSVEKAVTQLALAHGYRPDGWGFREP